MTNQPANHINQLLKVSLVGGTVVTVATTSVRSLARAALGIPVWVPCQSMAPTPELEAMQA